MGVVKALPQGLTGMLVSRAYSLLSALLLLGEASPLLGFKANHRLGACSCFTAVLNYPLI